MFDEPGTAREEAERLIAAVLAAATLAANAYPQISTGSADCCVCPLCKVIAAVRDPDPQMVERVATGAGDLAAGMASFLRHVSGGGAPRDSWHKATEPEPEMPEKKVVKKAVVKKAVAKKTAPKKTAPKTEEG